MGSGGITQCTTFAPIGVTPCPIPLKIAAPPMPVRGPPAGSSLAGVWVRLRAGRPGGGAASSITICRRPEASRLAGTIPARPPRAGEHRGDRGGLAGTGR